MQKDDSKIIEFLAKIGFGVFVVTARFFKILKFILFIPKDSKFTTPNLGTLLKTACIFLPTFVLGLVLLGQLASISSVSQRGEKLMSWRDQAPKLISDSLTALSEKRFEDASVKFLQASAIARGVNDDVISKNKFIWLASKFSSKGQTVSDLAEAMQNFGLAAASLSSGANSLTNLSFQDGTLVSATGTVSEVIHNAAVSIKAASDYSTKGSVSFSKIKFSSGDQSEFKMLEGLAPIVTLGSKSLSDYSKLLTALDNFCSGKHTILVFLQNNNELRASGGFIGTYSKIVSDNCNFTPINFQSVYELDGQMKERILAPSPLFHLSDKLYLRDAGWFIDGPENGKILTSLYEKEGGETPDLMVFVTPTVLTNLLGKIGGVEMNGLQLDSRNFVEQIQAQTSSDTDFERNKPKAVLGDIFPVIMRKLEDTDTKTKASVVTGFVEDLYAKHIWFYSRREDLQKSFGLLGLSAETKKAKGDYLYVNSSNLSGTKTDLNIKTNLKLKTNITSLGQIQNQLTLTKKNSLPTGKQFNNVSFVRIALPLGSKVNKVSGFSQTEEPGLDVNGYSHLQSVSNWQDKYKKGTEGVWLGEESGKLIVAGFLDTPGGGGSEVKVDYVLPSKNSFAGQYTLFLQKQPGSTGESFEHEINLEGGTFQWPYNITGQSNYEISAEISSDTFYGYIFKTKNN